MRPAESALPTGVRGTDSERLAAQRNHEMIAELTALRIPR